jgi:hypothetical protein
MSLPAKQALRDQPQPKSAATPNTAPRGSTKIALVSHSSLYGEKESSGPHVKLSESHFKRLLASVLEHVDVDEAWYARVYPDVGEAIKRGEQASARQHYKNAGYQEDRLPRPIPVDAEWYLNKYPGVEKAVDQGKFASAQEHFERFGFREGRLPYPDWSLCD